MQAAAAFLGTKSVTMNAEQDFIKCIEGLCMMRIKHAMLASDGIMPLWPVQELNMGNQNW